MKIECILKREGGTKAEIGGVEYHFKPDGNGAHVADVKDKAHIARFLSMPEGYAVYDPDEQDQDAGPGDQDDQNPAGTGADAGGEGGDQSEPKGDLNGDGKVDAKDERAALSEQYKAKFGKAPHHNMSADNIRKKLAE